MNTVIVPVDFSEISLHAAKYASQLLVGHYGVTLILYHSYAKASDEQKTLKELESLKDDLMKNHIVKIEILNHHEPEFVDGMERAIRHRKADLVIMGIRGRSALAQVFIGSNTLKVVETKACPVLIIPENAVFQPVKHVMLTSDFKNTLNTTPSAPIKDFLSRFTPKLHVVNVDKDHYISLTDNYEKEKQDLRQMFREYEPEFYFMRLFDIDEAINLFAEDQKIDLIIAVQRNQNFMEKLFKQSRTKTLSFHSKVPILVMHE